MAGPIGRRSTNTSQSDRGSRIIVAIIIGILLGCVFAVLYPHGLFSGPTKNRRLSKSQVRLPLN